ncbi:TnpV protein [Synergistaceae bacterium OttesenSCG-928-I11]|nr:TnpV protein [Synergistaceae bacterium OttesenSCG-928-I11]
MMEIEYVQAGDYLIPAIELDDVPTKPLGKYALMRRRHLETNDKVLYTTLQLKGELYSHLEEVDETARRQVNLFIERTLEKEPAPDKTNDPMAWVGCMENLKARAEEIVTRELIFA